MSSWSCLLGERTAPGRCPGAARRAAAPVVGGLEARRRRRPRSPRTSPTDARRRASDRRRARGALPDGDRRGRARQPFTATITNETSSTPPTLASARAGGKSWSATPRSPHGNPPNGQRPRSASSDDPGRRGEPRRRDARGARTRRRARRPPRSRPPSRRRAARSRRARSSRSTRARRRSSATPNTKPYSAACAGARRATPTAAGRARRATSGPRSNGGKQSPARTPAPTQPRAEPVAPTGA